MRVFCSSRDEGRPPAWLQTYKIGCSEMTPPSLQHLLYLRRCPVSRGDSGVREDTETCDALYKDTTGRKEGCKNKEKQPLRFHLSNVTYKRTRMCKF